MAFQVAGEQPLQHPVGVHRVDASSATLSVAANAKAIASQPRPRMRRAIKGALSGAPLLADLQTVDDLHLRRRSQADLHGPFGAQVFLKHEHEPAVDVGLHRIRRRTITFSRRSVTIDAVPVRPRVNSSGGASTRTSTTSRVSSGASIGALRGVITTTPGYVAPRRLMVTSLPRENSSSRCPR